MTQPKHSYSKETRLIHGEFHSPHWDYKNHIVPPISASTAYRLESAERGAEGFSDFANPEFNRHTESPIYIYDRLSEPSRSMLEDNLALAEEGECGVCFATGMAAISAALGVLCKTGDRIIAHRTLYGCTYSLLQNWLPRLGIQVSLVDCTNPKEVVAAMDERTVAVYFETPTNPTLELIDIAAIRTIVDAHNAKQKERSVQIIVDNTFATSFCQRPLSLGADIIVSSLTKNVGGFGTDMGGVVVAPRRFEHDLLLYRKDFGAPLGPRAAWPTLVYGLPTLHLRSKKQIANAMVVAEFLAQHDSVLSVKYPGLITHPHYDLAQKQMRDPEGNFAPGIMIYFVLKGSPSEALASGRRVMDYLADKALTVTLAVSLGQVRTLVEHPGSMTHAAVPLEAQAAAGIDPGGIRLSMGIESAKDIIADLSEALAV